MSGCISTPGYCKCSVWQKDSLVLSGTNCVGYGRRYNVLFIGDSKKYAEKLPDIFVDWPSGEKRLLSSITADILGNTKEFTSGQWFLGSIWVSTDWPEKTMSYVWGGYLFLALDDKIVGFQASKTICNLECSPEFWDKTLMKHYEFPIKHKEAVELFGYPDDISEFWCP